jgi:hypothetical protein
MGRPKPDQEKGQMSIADRLEDARLLYAHDRFEGALMSVLAAAAGTSALRYPKGTSSISDPKKKMPDKEKFVRFLDGIPPTAGALVHFRGKCTPVAEILYEYLRCSLMHAGKVRKEVSFEAGGSKTEARIDCDTKAPNIIVTHPVVMMLAHAVAHAPENADIPVELKRTLTPDPP